MFSQRYHLPKAWLHRRLSSRSAAESIHTITIQAHFTTHTLQLETMSDIGPELPPHLLAKRKRKQEQDAEDEAAAASGAKRSPTLGNGEKRRRVMGPAMPPAPLDERPERPVKPSDDSDSDDDDGFGPVLPSKGADEVRIGCRSSRSPTPIT